MAYYFLTSICSKVRQPLLLSLLLILLPPSPLDLITRRIIPDLATADLLHLIPVISPLIPGRRLNTITDPIPLNLGRNQGLSIIPNLGLLPLLMAHAQTSLNVRFV